MFDFFLLVENSLTAVPDIVNESVVEAKQDSTWHIPLCAVADSHLQAMGPDDLDKDWKLQEFFETIIVINLPHAEERLAR
ncbi:MAG: hypothetical protein LLG04_13815, partial [Parachlamydia sp.]|nr:hypothetical protein [Parachlamydia sp.]